MRETLKEISNASITNQSKQMPTIVKKVNRPWQIKREAFGGRKNPNKAFYQSPAWRALRAKFIAANPLCVECRKKGIITPAQVADHIIPINMGGPALSESNLQALCHKCHNAKSAKDKEK